MRAFEILDGRRLLVLNVAETLVAEGAQVMLVRTLPGVVVRWTETFQIIWGAGEREHRNRLADPDAVLAEIFLEMTHLIAAVVLGKDKIRLNPRHELASVDEQLANSLGGHAAVLVKLIATGVGDRLDAAFHRNAVGVAE